MSRTIILIFTIFIWGCANIFGQIETNAAQTVVKQDMTGKKTIPVKKWALCLEAGSGNILGLTFARQKLAGRFDVGVGGGFNASRSPVGEETYSMLFLNGNVSGTFYFIESRNFEVSARLQFGVDWLSVGGKFSSYAFDLTPALLAGYRNIYVALSGVVLLSKESVFLPQIGLGYKFQF